MSARAMVVGAGSALLAGAATTALPIDLRVMAVVVLGTLVTLGCQWKLAELTAMGLLGVVAMVGSGPAATAGSLGIIVWGTATWVVVMLAASASDERRVPTRDMAARVRTAAGPLLACLWSVPLAVLVTDDARAPAYWATAAGLALVGLLALGLAAVWRGGHTGADAAADDER